MRDGRAVEVAVAKANFEPLAGKGDGEVGGDRGLADPPPLPEATRDEVLTPGC